MWQKNVGRNLTGNMAVKIAVMENFVAVKGLQMADVL
jgi:hypothetical protein